MIAKTCIVIGGRFGDIINILPVARDIALKEGGKCAVMVSQEFASVLEGCSYVEPVVVSWHFTDTQPAIEQARKMFERVLVAKVSERAVGVTTQCSNFNVEAWRQIGYLNDWFRLPLVFDRRVKAREDELIRQVGNGRPMILVNFSGKSAPFEHGDHIKRLFSSDCNVVDLAGIRAPFIYDLIGLMDASQLLVTSDTSTLHLAAASGVPVVNLIGTKPTSWHGSKPRNNSVIRLTYDEVMNGVPTMIRDAARTWKPSTWHVWSDYPMDGDTLRRHTLAAMTWKQTSWIDFPVTDNRRVMKDPTRELPFVKDLINRAVNCADRRDTIVLTNSDTCLATGSDLRIKTAVEKSGCCHSYRRDFPSLDRQLGADQVRNGHRYAGSDLFAFSVDWWKRNGHRMPDMVLGAEAWDHCLRLLMKQTGGQEFDDLIAHERHTNGWENETLRHSLPSQLHNLSLAAPFIASHP